MSAFDPKLTSASLPLEQKAPDDAGAFSSSKWKSDHYFALKAPRLFLAVLFGMGLCCFFRVMPTMNRVRPRSVSVMRRLLVMSAFVMFGRFTVVLSSMRMMLRCLLMMFCSFLRHLASSKLYSALLGLPRFIAMTEHR
jgi:hypothetical protein